MSEGARQSSSGQSKLGLFETTAAEVSDPAGRREACYHLANAVGSSPIFGVGPSGGCILHGMHHVHAPVETGRPVRARFGIGNIFCGDRGKAGRRRAEISFKRGGFLLRGGSYFRFW